MRTLIFITALAAIGIPAMSPLALGAEMAGAQPQATALDKADAKFLQEAAIGGLLEVTLGQMAVKQAAHEDVKGFGQRMVDDHSKLNEQVARLAQQKGVNLPKSLDKEHQAQVDKLAKLSGVDFDKAYMKFMVEDHGKDVNEFSQRAREATDTDVKTLASTALPTLEHHLQMAKDLNARVNPAKKR